jgi:hypothetical protein
LYVSEADAIAFFNAASLRSNFVLALSMAGLPNDPPTGLVVTVGATLADSDWKSTADGAEIAAVARQSAINC